MQGENWTSKPSKSFVRKKSANDYYWCPLYWFNFDTVKMEEVEKDFWYHPFRWYYENGKNPKK